jgi:hypothetical protein
MNALLAWATSHSSTVINVTQPSYLASKHHIVAMKRLIAKSLVSYLRVKK